MVHDECYHKIMASYGKWSARAAQATAKCRKEKGIVRKTKQGENIKRWGEEKWVDEKGRPCGSGKKGETVKCRPSKKINDKTPVTWSEMSPGQKEKAVSEKRKVGMGRKASPIRRSSPKGKISPVRSPKRKSSPVRSPKGKWSEKYKRSIDCKNPKGFSQRAHCQSKLKRATSPKGSMESKPLYKPFPSKSGNSKYSVYVESKTGGKKLIHFGDKRYEQYHDKLGHYTSLDHKDPERRKSYRDRHKHDKLNDKNSAGYWAWRCLW